ncbi:MAG TPA: DUF4239 domain-containing protein [Pseudolabrys sp.]|nr:DUF4239 domain-containing protein [Pseudolabrys sp.]
MSELLYAAVFIGGAIVYAVVGVLIGRKIVHRHVREGHNDVLVPMFLTVGVIYAVLLGFTVVAEWEFYDSARANTAEEAALLVPLYRQTRVMEQQHGDEIRHYIRSYAEHVVERWEAFAHGERNTEAGRDTNEIIRVFSEMTPSNKSRELVSGQFLMTFSQMVLNRNKRYAQSAESLSKVMWIGIIVGGALTVALSFIVFMEVAWLHVLGVALMSALIGVMLFMAALFSRPFQGPLAIDPAPFETVLKVFDQVDKGQ